jgi:hypothetical protein
MIRSIVAVTQWTDGDPLPEPRNEDERALPLIQIVSTYL